MEEISRNIHDCNERIRSALLSAGRHDSVTLIGAVKTQPKEIIDAVAGSGLLTDIGDNRVQELMANYNPDLHVRRHFIGRLQTNKVKYIIDKVCLIHSLDRTELAKEIDRQACRHSLVADCLIEVNMGSEISKGGVDPQSLFRFADEVAGYKNIRVRGLMSVMPNTDDKKRLCELYAGLHKLYLDMQSRYEGVDVLSCGMTNDFETALIYGGSNMVRLGRVIFGERNYTEQNNG